MEILNAVTHLMAYSDSSGQTDNPRQRVFDWTRQFSGIEVANPNSDHKVVVPGGSYTIFDGSGSHSMDGTSTLSLALLPNTDPIYRLSVTGPAGFRTARAVSGIVACTVTVNNNAVAIFNFTSSTLTGVVAGDIMRINGVVTNDSGPYAFASTNAGNWVVIGVTGTAVSCVRPVGEQFSGLAEVVAVATNNVQFYSSSGIQVGDKIDISGSLSVVSWGRYIVADVTATSIYFVSGLPLPNETGIAYVPTTISFFTQSKKLVYIEADQESVVQLDGDTGTKVRISPMTPGSPSLVGYFHKWGDTYKCVVVNRSVNVMNLKWITGE